MEWDIGGYFRLDECLEILVWSLESKSFSLEFKRNI